MNNTEGERKSSIEKGSGRKKKVKVEGAPSLSWVDPLYAEQPTVTWNRVDPIKRDAFQKAYGLNNSGIPPKQLKFGVHLKEDDVEALFGQRQGGNGYNYSYSEDLEFVKKVERLWMITHQRTQVPNTRLINLAEAKGIVYEQQKGKAAVNWCVHAEWTCRDQLRRINAEKDTSKTEKTLALDVNDDDPDEDGVVATEYTGRTRSGALHSVSAGALLDVRQSPDSHAMAIGEWQEYVSLLERETPALEALVSRLCVEKDGAKMDLVKVTSQVDYGREILNSSYSKLEALEQDREKCELRLSTLKTSDLGNMAAIEVATAELMDVVKKVDLQSGFIDHFEDSVGLGRMDEEVISARSTDAEKLWSCAVKKQALWKRHKLALNEQLKQMKTGYQRPTMHPSPLPFLYLDCESIVVPVACAEIHACPFCCKGFEPAWDCRFSSCCHAYHT